MSKYWREENKALVFSKLNLVVLMDTTKKKALHLDTGLLNVYSVLNKQFSVYTI